MTIITIESDGSMRFIHDDRLQELLKEGPASIRRASHVEPDGLVWQADMAPVGGPLLGPYETRSAALDAEVDWLQRHHL